MSAVSFISAYFWYFTLISWCFSFACLAGYISYKSFLMNLFRFLIFVTCKYPEIIVFIMDSIVLICNHENYLKVESKKTNSVRKLSHEMIIFYIHTTGLCTCVTLCNFITTTEAFFGLRGRAVYAYVFKII